MNDHYTKGIVFAMLCELTGNYQNDGQIKCDNGDLFLDGEARYTVLRLQHEVSVFNVRDCKLWFMPHAGVLTWVVPYFGQGDL